MIVSEFLEKMEAQSEKIMALQLAHFLDLKRKGNLNPVANFKMAGTHEKEKLQWETQGRKTVQAKSIH